MFYPTLFGQGASNSDLHAKYSVEIEGLSEREATIYIKAREGELDYSEVNTPQDAEWACNGYRERRDDKTLPLHERRHASEFIENIECDFGDGSSDIWSAQDEQETF